jgi:hypothetical protein
MATLKKELREILDRYGINPRDTSQVWDCHGTLVLYHRAYEIIAAKENITFHQPMVLEANGAAKSVALCVSATMGDRTEWATGEAAPANCKNAYPYAMAEKRAKDRVVGKLVGLAQYVYSEDEAEEFKSGERKAVEAPAENPPPSKQSEIAFDAKAEAQAIKALFDKCQNIDQLNLWVEDTTMRRKRLPVVTQDWFTKLFQDKLDNFMGKGKAA